MEAGRRLAIVVILAAALFVIPSATAEEGGQDHEPVVVGFEDVSRAPVENGTWANHSVDERFPHLDALRVLAQPDQLRETVQDRPNVAFVELDRPVRAHLVPDDPRYPDQEGPDQIRLPEAWNTQLGTSDVQLAIVDSGIDNDHEDLSGAVVAERDLVEDDGTAQDDCGHGTHVAGIAAARTDNDVGIAGSAQVDLLDARVLAAEDGACTGTTSDLADGIRWSVDQGADVVSMSVGLSGTSSLVDRAIAHAVDQDAVLVASAGNQGPCGASCVTYPGSHPDVIAVACTTDTESRCDFSSQGPEVELAAPGAQILSTGLDDSYQRLSGTSMSAPFVSGTAALARAQNGDLDRAQVREALQDNAQDLGPDGRDASYGYGEVDAAATLANLDAVLDDNEPPVADFVHECVSLTCTFEERAYDPDGDELSHEWTMRPGRAPATGRTVEHTYPEPEDPARAGSQSYDVTLTVSDGQVSTSVTRTVTVRLEADLSVRPLEPTFGPFEQPTIEVSLVREDADAVDGTGAIGNIPVDVRTYWSPNGEPAFGLYGSILQEDPAASQLRDLDLLYHDTRERTNSAEWVPIEVPGEAGSQAWAPTTGHHVVALVEAEVAGLAYTGQTVYEVRPTG